MPEPITIQITTDASGAVTGIQAAGQSLESFKGQVSSAGEAAQGSTGGLASLVGGMRDVESAFNLGGKLASSIGEWNAMGVEINRARTSLDAMTDNHAAQWMQDLTTSTRGLVDDEMLAQRATTLLSMGVANTYPEIQKMITQGAQLGEAFQGSATAGIDSYTQALERVGSKRALYSLHLDINQVMSDFEKFKASGMDAQSAWSQALGAGADAQILKLGDSFDKTGTALERLQVGISNLKDDALEGFAKDIQTDIELLNNFGKTAQTVFDYVNNHNPQVSQGPTPTTPEARQSALADTISGKGPVYDPLGIMGAVGGQSGAAAGANNGPAKNSDQVSNSFSGYTAAYAAQNDMIANGNALEDARVAIMQKGLAVANDDAATQSAIAHHIAEQRDLTQKVEGNWLSAPGQGPSSLSDIEKAKIDYMKNAMRSGGTAGAPGWTEAQLEGYDAQTANMKSGKMSAAQRAVLGDQRTAGRKAGIKGTKGSGGSSLYSKGQIDQESAAMQKANDKIALALGQTTKEALAGRNALDAIGKAYSTSGESADQYADKVIAANKAMQAGDMQTLANLQVFGTTQGALEGGKGQQGYDALRNGQGFGPGTVFAPTDPKSGPKSTAQEDRNAANTKMPVPDTKEATTAISKVQTQYDALRANMGKPPEAIPAPDTSAVKLAQADMIGGFDKMHAAAAAPIKVAPLDLSQQNGALLFFISLLRQARDLSSSLDLGGRAGGH